MPTDPTPQAEQRVCEYCVQPITEWDGVWYGPPDADNVCDPICDRSETLLHAPADPSPAPHAEQEWFCVSCNHPHTMHQNAANGQSCHCGGCTAWVPELRPAEPSPAPPSEDDLTQLYEEAKRNGAGTYSGSHIIPLIESLTAAREERDRARDALRAIRLRVNRQFAVKTIDAALKPVSDRQPEGEKRMVVTQEIIDRLNAEAGANKAVTRKPKSRFGDSDD